MRRDRFRQYRFFHTFLSPSFLSPSFQRLRISSVGNRISAGRVRGGIPLVAKCAMSGAPAYYSLDRLFHMGNTTCMAWDVEFTGQFEAWWNSLSEEEQVEVSAKVELLQERGPTLPRPHADVISTSRHANMKELRGKSGGSPPARAVRV